MWTWFVFHFVFLNKYKLMQFKKVAILPNSNFLSSRAEQPCSESSRHPFIILYLRLPLFDVSLICGLCGAFYHRALSQTGLSHSSPGPLILTCKIDTSKWILSLNKPTKNGHCKSCKVSHNWHLGGNKHSWKQETCQIIIEVIKLRRKCLLDERLRVQPKCKRRAVPRRLPAGQKKMEDSYWLSALRPGGRKQSPQ